MKEREGIINILKNFFNERAEDFHIEMAFLFGSWAKGFPVKESDIDIAIVFSEKLDSQKVFEYLTEVSYRLIKIIGKEVNSIHIRKDFDKPMLYYNAIVLGVPVYIKDEQSYIDIKNEAIFQMEDFSIFGIPWQIRLCEKNLKEINHDKI